TSFVLQSFSTWASVSNCAGSETCVKSPVCSRNSGTFGNALMCVIVSRKVPHNVRVCRFIKTDVTVAYLDKVQLRRRDYTSVICFLAQHRGSQQSSVDGPNDDG